MKKIILILLFVCVSTLAWCGKAVSIPTTIVQPDGSRLTVILYGDEHFHWSETLDGVLLYQEGTAYYVATIDEEGLLLPTEQLAHEKSARSAKEKNLVMKQNRSAMLSAAQKRSLADRRRREAVHTNSEMFPHTGEPHVLVVLAEFADVSFSVANPRATFEQYLNSQGTQQNLGNREDLNYGSVSKYFKNSSFGQFSPKFDIVGPVRLPENLAVYGAGRNDRMDLFIPAVVAEIKDSVDFRNYDANGDRSIDLIYVIYAGYSANITGNSSDCIWPKSGVQVTYVGDGLSTSRYGVNSELNAYPDAFSTAPYERVNGIGMFCHEFSHCMGLPDFYPTESSAREDNQALEYWSLMDGGENLRNGWNPCSYTAWEREAMGWMEIEELTNDTTITLLPIDAEGGKAFRIRNPYDNSNHEYFILENIQRSGWNSRHYGNGLLVFHVDYDSAHFSISPLGTNKVNCVLGKPRMTIVPADGLLGTSYNKGKIKWWGTGEGGVVTNSDYTNQHAGDPYPGSSAKTSLSSEDNIVNYSVYTSTKMNWALTDISENNGAITFTFIRDKTTTGITDKLTTLQNEKSKNWYTIEGIRLYQKPLKKGIYIHGNRKVVIN